MIEAYNSAAWDGVVQTRGFGIGSFNAMHTFLRARPKTARRKMMVGIHSLLETTSIIASGNNMRATETNKWHVQHIGALFSLAVAAMCVRLISTSNADMGWAAHV